MNEMDILLGAKILIVDDIPANISALFHKLTHRGATVLVAQSGEDALELVRENLPDLILLDIMMPGMDGFQVCKKLKSQEETQKIPVIFLTAKTEEEDLVKGFQLGAADYLTKPFRKDELMARVRTQLRLKFSEEQLSRLLEDYRSAKEAAEAANREKSLFLAKMSHEIRTPMNAILGMTDLTLQSRLDDEQRENLSLVRDSANHLMQIINDILDLSRIEAGKIIFEQIDFDLDMVLKSVIRTLSVQSDKKGLFLKWARNPELPSILKGDPIRIRQILINLVGNAIKFTDTGGVTVQVEPLQAGEPESERVGIQIHVNDTGIGIPSAKLDAIFDNFSQGSEDTARKYGGSGLGLSICQQLAQRMGGDIRVKSREGAGSTFSVSLFLASGNAEKIEPEIPEPVQQQPEAAIPGLKILIAEDNPVNSRIAQSFLERLNHRTSVAVNGAEALEYLRKEPFDILFMDVEMPVMDGIEATKHIRAGEAGATNSRIPIIAMTAHALAEFKQRCEAAGMDDYVTKPVNFYDLDSILARNLPCIDGAAAEIFEPEHPEKEIVNERDLLRRIGGNAVLMHQIYLYFLENQPEMFRNLQEAIAEKDFDKIRRVAHTTKGTFLSLGAEICAGIASRIEQQAQAEEIEEIPALLHRLEQELKRVISWIQARRNPETKK